MAVNIVKFRNSSPIMQKNEQLIHLENECKCQITTDSKEFQDNGTLFTTNLCLIFKSNNSRKNFNSFILPYNNIKKYKFKKPLIGTSNISGKFSSIKNGGLKGNENKFIFTFKDGNIGKICFNKFDKSYKNYGNNNNNNESKSDLNGNIDSDNPFSAPKPSNYGKNIVVGQSVRDAPTKLTKDGRTNKAKLFPQNNRTVNTGIIKGASPVNVNAFKRRPMTGIRHRFADDDSDSDDDNGYSNNNINNNNVNKNNNNNIKYNNNNIKKTGIKI